jgi:hypothetical protein
MYILFILKNNQMRVLSFQTQAECYSFVSQEQVTKYKIYPPSKKRSITFLSAMEWSDVADDFVINVPIAKEIKKNHLREIRGILFDKLDKAFLRAIETEDSEKRSYIINLKNQFRDITDLDLPDEEEALLNFMPSVFKEVYDLSI